ncbi:MAG: histidinol dehydrogenase [Phycisphaerae bacterium]|nr:histidinol dehydrogenase [Phycisphaerae bacterium]
MTILNKINTNDSDFDNCWANLMGKLSLQSHLIDDKQRLNGVRNIVDRVRQGGDDAIVAMTAEFDGVSLKPDQFRISENELKQAHGQIAPELLAAIRKSIENVKAYQQAIKIPQPADWENDGVRLGVRHKPLRRVGVCVPGASAPLVSTVIMTVVPAIVAGVAEIAVISSPSYNGSIHPDVLAVCYELGVTDVYRISGAQGVAALAFGTDHIKKVDKIVGPGNWWGQLAKKEVYGLVDVDSFAGPSEVLIIADKTANPAWVAADMLSQAEHAPGSAILVTDCGELADKVDIELEKQLSLLARAEKTKECVQQFCLAVTAENMDAVIAIADEFAAEHLQIQTADSNGVAERIKNAGAIFIGHHSPVATGDYFAGPSHTLPTGTSARFFSALSVNDFLKQTSIINYNADSLKKASDSITTIAKAEGLDAHAKSVTIRVKN